MIKKNKYGAVEYQKEQNWAAQYAKRIIETERQERIDESNALSQRIGENADLDTSNTDTVVGAINEVHNSFNNFNNCEEYKSVEAIKEALDRERQERIDTDYNNYKDLLSRINTSKTELEAEISEETNAISDVIGATGELDTDERTIVNAINEVNMLTSENRRSIGDIEAFSMEIEGKDVVSAINETLEIAFENGRNIEVLNDIKASKIITTASGTDTVTITDADGVDMLVSGGTALSKEPSPKDSAGILGVTSINVNGTAVNTEENPIYNSDAIDVTTGKIKRKMAMYQFTGDENFNVISGMDNRFVNGGIFDYTQVVHPANNSTIANIYCTHFAVATYGKVTASGSAFTDNAVGLIGGNYNHIAFSYSGAESADEFKSFLKQEYEKGTPVTVLYELVEGTEEDIDVSDVSLVKGENQIAVIGNGSEYNFNVIYSADTKLYIDKKFSELQNAILATGGNV